MLTINSIVASDYLIIPSKTDYTSYIKINTLLDNMEESKKYNPNIKFLGVVKDSVRVKDGVHDGLSIIETNPNHEISKEYQCIANKVVKSGEK